MDFIEVFTDNWMGRIIGLILLGMIALVVFYIGGSIYLALTHHCVASHDEVQYEMPPGVVVGGSKYGGGVSIPVGNARPVNVTVCDKYESNN